VSFHFDCCSVRCPQRNPQQLTEQRDALGQRTLQPDAVRTVHTEMGDREHEHHQRMKWICCQLGAREHYGIPRALFGNGMLECLLTDAVVGAVFVFARARWRYSSNSPT
jgi:hypothetical protein